MSRERRTPGKTTPVKGKTEPIRQPPRGPVRRPGERYGPNGTSDEIGHGGDHIFGPAGNMERVMLAGLDASRGSGNESRGGPSGGGRGGKDGYGPNGTSDDIGQGPDLPGFLGGTMFA